MGLRLFEFIPLHSPAVCVLYMEGLAARQCDECFRAKTEISEGAKKKDQAGFGTCFFLWFKVPS